MPNSPSGSPEDFNDHSPDLSDSTTPREIVLFLKSSTDMFGGAVPTKTGDGLEVILSNLAEPVSDSAVRSGFEGGFGFEVSILVTEIT